MALLRFLAGTIEITAALLMLKLGRVKSAMKINSVLGLIGPLVLSNRQYSWDNRTIATFIT